MGILRKSVAEDCGGLERLPSGSFTMDGAGQVVSSTLPRAFPASRIGEIGRGVMAYFESARQAQVPVGELVVVYPSLRLTARKLRAGAIVFLTPLITKKN